MEKLYHDILMDHYRYPRYKGRLEGADTFFPAENPSCGDRVHIWVKTQDGNLMAASFEGAGCVISQAAASILLERAVGQKCEDIMAYAASTMFDLIGMQLGPVRSRCALLALEALQRAIASCPPRRISA